MSDHIVKVPLSSLWSVVEVAVEYPWNVQFDGRPVVLDVGANVGIFSLRAIQLWGAVVIAYEPHPESAKLYRENVGGRALLNEAAVSSKGVDGKIRLFDGKHNRLCCSTVDIGGQSEESVEVACISPDKLPYCSVLKVDTEGAEVDIITNYKHTPLMIMAECHRKIDFEQINSYLTSKEYELVFKPQQDAEIATYAWLKRQS